MKQQSTQATDRTADQFTGGEWEAGKAYSRSKNDWYAVIFCPTKTGKFHSPRSAEALGIDKDECEANAALIAKAPEMYRVLQEIIESAGSNVADATGAKVSWDSLSNAKAILNTIQKH